MIFSFLFLSLARAGIWLLYNGLLHRQLTLYSVVSLFHSWGKWNFETLFKVDTTQVLLSFYRSLPYFIMHVFSIINIFRPLIFFTQCLYPGVLNILINKFKRCMDQNAYFIQTQQKTNWISLFRSVFRRKKRKEKKRNPVTPAKKRSGPKRHPL